MSISEECENLGCKNRVAGSKGFAEASSINDKIFEFSKKFEISLIPRYYEILFDHFSGHNDEISFELDKFLCGSGEITESDLEKIHGKYYLRNANLDNVGFETTQILEKELGDIAFLFENYANANETYNATLRDSVRSIGRIDTADGLASKVSELLLENEKMRKETEELSATIEISREQIHDLKRCLAAAIEESMRDVLTGLANRRWLERDISDLLTRKDIRNTSHCFALIDLDRFKRINDKFGHIVGDEVLKFFSKILRENVKGKDICTRMGGEEFSVTLKNTSILDAGKVMEEVRSKLEKSNLILSNSKKSIGIVTASFGITQILDGDSFEDIYNRADSNLYAAKRSGRNCIVSCNSR